MRQEHFSFGRWRRVGKKKAEAERAASAALSASTQIANTSLTELRQNGFIERVARIADEHPEHREMRGGPGEDRMVDDQKRLGSAVEGYTRWRV